MTDKPKEPQLVRRIDRNSVVGDKAVVLKMALSDEKKTHFVYRVGGVCIGTVRGVTRHAEKASEWIKLIGRFQAVNWNGDIFRSGAAFLPSDLANLVADRLEHSNSETPQAVFLFDVFVRYDSSLATSYGFIVEPVRKPDETDPLDALFNEAQALPAPTAQKALEAPKKTK
jgi:hypothetical protein